MKLSHRRQLAMGKREAKRDLSRASAAELIGPITHGCEIFCLFGGQFSLIDALAHVLAGTGPADVVISTWTAASADLGFAYELLREKRVRSLEFLADFSFGSRQPSYLAALRERFGDESVRMTKLHAKFCLVQNDEWHVAMRTSANLNENKRLETLEISDDPGLAAFLQRLVDDLFAGPSNVHEKPGAIMREFAEFAGQQVDTKSTDVRKVMGDEAFATDVRRAGLQFLKGGE